MCNLYKNCSHGIQFSYILWVSLPKLPVCIWTVYFLGDSNISKNSILWGFLLLLFCFECFSRVLIRKSLMQISQVMEEVQILCQNGQVSFF